MQLFKGVKEKKKIVGRKTTAYLRIQRLCKKIYSRFCSNLQYTSPYPTSYYLNIRIIRTKFLGPFEFG